MAKLYGFFAAVAIVTSFVSQALAGPRCTDEARSNWMSEADFKSKIAASGIHIEVFKTTKGNCYEVYGRSADGKRVEIYFDPVTAQIVKREEI